jgi:hypothetical protein
MRLRTPAWVAVCLTATSLAQAQTALSTPEQAFVGRWDIAHVDETPDHCVLSLLKEETIGGRQVALSKGCAKELAWTGDITAWWVRPDGTLVLADALRHGLIGFKRDATGDLTGIAPDQAMYMLYPVKPKKK